MNLAAISSMTPTHMPETQPAAQAPTPSSVPSHPTDMVTLSSAARTASAGDVDHDGDSH